MAVRKQPFQNKINCAELNEYKTVKKQNVDDSALFILYPAFTFFQEIVTFLILIAVVWAFYRRYIEKLVRLKRGFKAGLVLLFIGGLIAMDEAIGSVQDRE
jgi:hypothetical protein